MSPIAHERDFLYLMTEKKREDRKVSKQYRGLTGAGLAQGKVVSVGAVPRFTGKQYRGSPGTSFSHDMVLRTAA